MSELILNRLGHSLRDLRKQRGLSQQQLAELAGTSRKAVINAEKGHAGLSIGAFVALAEAMGAEVTAVAVRRPTTEEIKALLKTDTEGSQDARRLFTPSEVFLPVTKKSAF